MSFVLCASPSVKTLAVFSVVLVNDEKKTSTWIFFSPGTTSFSEEFLFLRPPTILRGTFSPAFFSRYSTGAFSFTACNDGEAGGGVSEIFSLFCRTCKIVRMVRRTANVERIIGIRYKCHNANISFRSQHSGSGRLANARVELTCSMGAP